MIIAVALSTSKASLLLTTIKSRSINKLMWESLIWLTLYSIK